MKKLLFFLTILIILPFTSNFGLSPGIYTIVVKESSEKFYAPEIWPMGNTDFVRIDLNIVDPTENNQFHHSLHHRIEGGC